MTRKLGMIAEDESDVGVIDILIQKIVQHRKYTIKRFLGHGCGKIRSKCNAWANNLRQQDCTVLILVHDSDSNNPTQLKRDIETALAPCPIQYNIIVIPVREIEAWLLSDHGAIQRAIGLKSTLKQVTNPEAIHRPKEHLAQIVRQKSKGEKIYISTIHNKKIASEVHIKNLRRCQSFLPLENFVYTHIR